MGAKLTGTLVAANLLAVSGVAGLQLYGAVRALEADQYQTRIAAIDFHQPDDQAANGALAAESRYPLHPVRVVTRSLDGVGPDTGLETGLIAAVAVSMPVETEQDQTSPDRPSVSLPLIAEAGVIAETGPEDDLEPAGVDLELIADQLGQLTTAAGPAHSLRALAPPGRASPEEAWRASAQLQVAYRAKLPDPAASAQVAPVASAQAVPIASAQAKPAVAATVSGHEKAREFLAKVVRPSSPIANGYVIIGSYGTRENAGIELETFAHWQPEIMSTEVDGKTYFRVAVGPFTKPDLSRALKAIIADGAKRAWPLVPKGPAQVSAKQ